jgi:hypothetical protein
VQKEIARPHSEFANAFPVLTGIMRTLDSQSGVSIFGLKHLPPMIAWIKFLRSRLSQRLSKAQCIKCDTYNAQWVLVECKNHSWGKVNTIRELAKEFVVGWNHLASRATLDKDKKGQLIREDEKTRKDERKVATAKALTVAEADDEIVVPGGDDAKADDAVAADERGIEGVGVVKGLKGTGFVRKLFGFRARPKATVAAEVLPSDSEEEESDSLEDGGDDDDEKKYGDEEDAKDAGLVEVEELSEQKQLANAFSRFILFRNACQTVPITTIDAFDGERFIEENVSLITALYSTRGLSETSPMIELIISHYAEAQNALLRAVHGFATTQEAEEGGLGAVRLCELSNESQVFSLTDESFVERIQSSTVQTVEYGQQRRDGAQLTVNMALLETEIKEEFIVGRKQIISTMDNLVFECSDEYEMTDVIADIDRKWKITRHELFFSKCDEATLLSIKQGLVQRVLLSDDRDGKDADADPVTELFERARSSVERTLIHLRGNVSSPRGSVSDYMRKVLRMGRDDAFNRAGLELCHLRDLWGFLRREIAMKKGDWDLPPLDCVQIYRSPIGNQKTKDELNKMMRSVADTELLWQFLQKWRDYLKKTLNQYWPRCEVMPLKEHLIFTMDSQEMEELTESLPDAVLMTHAGAAYTFCAQEFKRMSQ